jgi:small GTP-binding protein
MENKFDEAEEPTTGATWQIWARDKKGEKFELQIWDTAGQEAFKSLGPLYYRRAVGAVVVYDVTDRRSFEHVEAWIQDFVYVAGADAIVYIVGNKIDQAKRRTVSSKEGMEWARQNGRAFFETSAQSGENVRRMFDALMADIGKRATSVSQPRTTAVPEISEESQCAC